MCCPKNSVSILTQIKNATVAYATWVAAGMPKRSPTLIAALFDFCTKCPSNRYQRISAERGKCLECGCFLKRVPGGLNKLELVSEGCPRRHWPPQLTGIPDDV